MPLISNNGESEAMTHCKKTSLPRGTSGRVTGVWGRHVLALAAVLGMTGVAVGETYYIAVDGSDANSGAVDSPFGSFDHAISQLNAGDTLYVRGGEYALDAPVHLNKAGTAGSKINLHAMPGESPILDFSNNTRHSNVPDPRADDTIASTQDAYGLHIAGGADHWHVKGLTIQNAPYYGVRIFGSNNTVEQITSRYNKASGLEITGKESWNPGHNLILNSDSYRNFDPQSNGEDADGFAAKWDVGPGNVFQGVRAWSNADDGYDFWHAEHTVLIEDSWAFDNGFARAEWASQYSGSWGGDGLGFKLGQDAAQLVLNRVAAWGNKAFGIDENGNGSPDGLIINNATLVNNAKDGNPIQISLNDGSPHTITNTIAFDVDGDGVIQFDSAVEDYFNTWNGIGVTADDFQNLDMALLFEAATGERNPDGSLPIIGLHLAPDSHLIDAGTDVGLPYNGSAPDLGAFETIPEPATGMILLGATSLLLVSRATRRQDGREVDVRE